MAKITNIAPGPRGFHSLGGEVLLDRGQSWEGEISEGELASAHGTGFFEIDGARFAPEPGPLDQSVEKLTAYLETVEDPDEIEKLIAAETAGKSRSGAIAALEARRDALLA